jgi:EmrB/QacA subfamily drug resistance transporter
MSRQWKVLLVTSVAVFMAFLDVTIVNIAFPDIGESFPESSLAELSWILNAYAIVIAALLVPAGKLADIVGRKRMFFVGLWTFLIASTLCALAPTVEVLIAARVLQAVGAAIVVPTSLGLMLPEFPAAQRATATAIWSASGAVAAAAGPSLGGVLVDVAGWRWVFLVNLFIGIPAVIPARRLLVERRDEAAARVLPDVAGSLLLVFGVGLLALGIVQGPEWGWRSTEVVGSLAAGAVLIVLFAARSLSHANPVIEPELFRIRSFAVACFGTFGFFFAFYALLLCNVLFLTQVWGYSTLTAGFALTVGPLTAAVFAPIGGKLSDRFGQRVVAVPGGLIFGAGCLLLATVPGAEPNYWGEVFPAMLVTGAGVGLSVAGFGSAAVAELPPSRFSTGSAINGTFRQLGAVFGVSVLVAVLGTPAPEDAVATFHSAYAIMAAVGAGAGLLGLALGRVRATSTELAPEPGTTTSAAPA